MIKNAVIAYFVTGVILTPATAVWATRRNPAAFSPFEVLIAGPSAVTLLVLLWPLWVGISVLETFGLKILDRPLPPESQKPPASERGSNLPPLGVTGVSDTELKPSGKVRIGGSIIDAITEGGFLPSGTRVVVVGHSMGNTIVREDVEQTSGAVAGKLRSTD